MYSAKKKDGRPLYELAREGIEVEREPKLCHLYDFHFKNYEKPDARFSVTCSSGTYIRTLSQDSLDFWEQLECSPRSIELARADLILRTR